MSANLQNRQAPQPVAEKMVIKKHIEMKLIGQDIDVVGVVDDLLVYCAAGNSIKTEYPATDDAIVLHIKDKEDVVLVVDCAQWKFRSICARLCSLSSALNPQLDIFTADAALKIGEAIVSVKAHNGTGKRFFSIAT